MKSQEVYLAVDLGASSGRVMAGGWDGEQFSLQEVHRFANGGVRLGAHLHWNVLGIWSGILDGVRNFGAQAEGTPRGIGVDAWGVDFGLLDRRGELMGNPRHYRDGSTHGMVERVAELVDAKSFFQATGVQPMSINTVYQLFSRVLEQDEELARAETLLPIPDLFQYFLSGAKRSEYTEATTTQLFSPATRDWAWPLVERLGIPGRIFAPPVQPATVLGPVLPQVLEECGYKQAFPAIAVASHDTASAVAATPGMNADSAFLSCGTWSLMGALLDELSPSPQAFAMGFTHEGSVDGGLLCLRNLTGLWILQECMRCWQVEGKQYRWEDLLNAAECAAPLSSLIDTDAEEFLAPISMPEAIADWCRTTGQSIPHTPGEITRCVLESLSLAYRRTWIDLATVTGRRLQTVRLVGGGARNTLLCQMTADACAAVVVAGPVEAAALGNVLAQAVATGGVANFQQAQEALRRSEALREFQPRSGTQWQAAAARLAEKMGRRGNKGVGNRD